MDIARKKGQTIALLTLAILVVPMLVFPKQFGTELARSSLVNALYELVYYGVIFFMFNRRVTLSQLVQAAGVCLIYRLAVGAVFGIAVAFIYSMKLSISLQLGMSSYLPAILFHIAVAPFIMRPAVSQLIEYRPKRRPVSADRPDLVAPEQTGSSIAISKGQGIVSDAQVPGLQMEPDETQAEPAMKEVPAGGPSSDVNGFERATGYIGEHGSVKLAAVVDHEGLLLSNFNRGNYDPEDWSPIPLMITESNRAVLDRADYDAPEKIDLVMQNDRVIVSREKFYSLMVVAERQSDEFLNIRINQGMDIIRKYVDERYSQPANDKAEKIYVSGTE